MTMFNQKMVASIKVKGKILREFKDTVYVPFNSEFTILLKNLNTVRAIVNVFIDGENAVPGGLVIDPGRSVDLERWIKNGNLTEGNRFKFIERTAAIENGPRGIKEEDGLIRVEYQFEMPRPVINSIATAGFPQYPSGFRSGDEFYTKALGPSTGILRGFGAIGTSDIYAQATSVGTLSDTNTTLSAYANETGITVPGSRSEQKFHHTTVGTLDPTVHSIVLRIVGDLGNNKPVTEAVTVNHKPECVTCGHKNKHNARFCSQCGTALEIFA